MSLGLPDVPPVILAVDDDPIQLAVVDKYLGNLGHVVTSGDGVEALELAGHLRPDLILLDLQMPVMDGYRVLAALRSDPDLADTPVIVVTADSGPELESHCLEAGAVDFIVKPINPRVLRARAVTHLTLRRQAALLREMAFRDGLTGALNRRMFDDRLELEWNRAARDGTPLSLAIIDLDNFKLHNDTYGHLAGDELLREVVTVLEPMFRRPADVFARFGGEEFAVLLPDTPLVAAQALMAAGAQALHDRGLRSVTSPTGKLLTVSIGIASTQKRRGASAESLLHRADEQMYRAKAEGKDRICSE